jgi:hypothetical protein
MGNPLRLSVVVVLALAAATARAEGDGGASPSSSSPVLATLRRTACYGTCPAYQLTVRADGTVEYVGKEYVVERGARTAKISSAKLLELRQAFAAARYLELTENFACREWTDHPKVITSYVEGARSKTIIHDLGCKSPEHAKALGELEDAIDRIAGSARWVGTQAERATLPPE